MRILIAVIILSALMSIVGYAKDGLSPEEFADIKKNAPELILHNEDFTYDKYKDSLKWLQEFFDECYKQDNYDNYDSKSGLVTLKVYWDTFNIGTRNNLLSLEGYGLITQRDMLCLKLENAKLKGASKKEIARLEQILKDIEKQIAIFLKENIWVD